MDPGPTPERPPNPTASAADARPPANPIPYARRDVSTAEHIDRPGVPGRRWRAPVWIFVGFMLLYQINGRHLGEVDCVPAPYVAWSLVHAGTLDLRAFPALRERAPSAVRTLDDGSLLSKYPLGSSLAAVPFLLPYVVTGIPPDASHSAMARFGKWVAASYVAGIAVLVYLLCQRLAPAAAAPAVVFIGAGTPLWSTASQALWSHGPAAFFVCGAMFCLLRRTEGPRHVDALLAGAALGLSLLCRPTTAWFAAASVAALVANGRVRQAGLVLIPVALFGSWLAAYNLSHFGDPLAGGYLGEARRFDTPLARGLAGLLLSPSRGLLVYAPALWLLPFGLCRLASGRGAGALQRSVLWWWLLAALLTLLLYSRWHVWWGGWSFGPRFLTETLPVLGVVFALSYADVSERFGRKGRALAWGMVALSVGVQFVGVFGHGSDWMLGKQGADMFSLTDTQIAAHAWHVWTDRPAALLLPLGVGLAALGVRAVQASRRSACSRA